MMFKEGNKMIITCLKIFVESTKLHGIVLVLSRLLKALINVWRLFLLQMLISFAILWVNNKDIEMTSFAKIIVLFGVSYIFESVLEYIHSVFDIKCEWLLKKNLSKKIFLKLRKIEYKYYEDSEMYNCIVRMNEDLPNKVKISFNSFIDACSLFITVVGTVFVFLQVGIILVVSLLAVLFVSALFSVKGMNILNQIKYSQSKDQRMLNYYLDLMTGKDTLLELVIFQAREFIRSKRVAREKKVIRRLFKKSIVAGLIYNLSIVSIMIWFVFAMLYCSQQIIQGNIDVSIFVVIIHASLTILNDMENLSYQMADTTKNMDIFIYYTNFMKFSEIIEEKISLNLSCNNLCKKTVKFDNVSFRYPRLNEDVLLNISFELDMSKKYAIVGENGAGKSTIIKLLFGLYEPQKGKITGNIDGIGVVYQDFVKYELSVRENIILGNIDLHEKDFELLELLDESNCSEIINVAGGLDRKLGRLYENSIDLSGGQWQHLAIARGLAASSKFMVFDEPTSSMDPIAESKMYDSFFKKDLKRGSLTISHRLASAKQADHIFVIKDKIIFEQGTHSELLTLGGYYSELYRKQSIWYQED